jgi:hypothetical protein
VRDALTIANVDNPIWAIVVVNHLDLFNGKIEYKIRMNFTTTPPTTDTIHRRRKGVLTYYKQYYTSGFLSLQVQLITFYVLSNFFFNGWALALSFYNFFSFCCMFFLVPKQMILSLC